MYVIPHPCQYITPHPVAPPTTTPHLTAHAYLLCPAAGLDGKVQVQAGLHAVEQHQEQQGQVQRQVAQLPWVLQAGRSVVTVGQHLMQSRGRRGGGSGLRAQGSGFRLLPQSSEFPRCRAQGQGSRIRAQGSGFRVQAYYLHPKYRVQGSRIRVQAFYLHPERGVYAARHRPAEAALPHRDRTHAHVECRQARHQLQAIGRVEVVPLCAGQGNTRLGLAWLIPRT